MAVTHCEVSVLTSETWFV